MSASPLFLTGPAATQQLIIEVIEAGRMWDRHHEVRSGVLDQAFDLPLVVPLSRPTKAIGEKVMADEPGERACSLALPIPADPGNRDLRVIVKDRQRHTAEEGERRYMPIQKRLGCLRWIDLHKAGIRLRQVHAEEVHLPADTIDHAHRFAKIHLCMSWRVRQRHERLASPRPAQPDIILYDSVATAKAMLVA